MRAATSKKVFNEMGYNPGQNTAHDMVPQGPVQFDMKQLPQPEVANDFDDGFDMQQSVETDFVLGGLFGGNSFAMSAVNVANNAADLHASQGYYQKIQAPAPTPVASSTGFSGSMTTNKGFEMHQPAPEAPSASDGRGMVIDMSMDPRMMMQNTFKAPQPGMR